MTTPGRATSILKVGTPLSLVMLPQEGSFNKNLPQQDAAKIFLRPHFLMSPAFSCKGNRGLAAEVRPDDLK